MTEIVTLGRKYGDWESGTVQIGDGPKTEWVARNSREAIEKVHRILGEHGLNPKEPGSVTWHHTVVGHEKKEDE